MGKNEGRVGRAPRARKDLSLPNLVFDDCLECLEWLRPGKEPAVDEERRRSGHTHGLTLPVVLLDRLPELPGIEALAECAGVELQVGGDLTVGPGGKRALVLEDPIVILPELSLFVSAKRGLRGRLSFGVVGKRVVAIDEPDFVPVGLLNLL